MKQLYLIALMCFISFLANAQNAGNKSTTTYYQKSLNEKEDFLSKVKSVFKSKKNTKEPERSSDPVLVKNDPNRTIKRVSKQHYRKPDQEVMPDEKVVLKEKALAMAKPVKNETPVTDKNNNQVKNKKSLGEFWSQLVNGKDYVPQKNYNKIKRPAVAARQMPAAENNIVNTKAAERHDQYTQPVKRNAYKTENGKKSENNVSAVKLTAVKPAEKSQEPAIADNTIRNEIKPLSLTQTSNGTASYFFTGDVLGKFYVVTNLASKGSVIKITNPQNGKSLLAEVVDYLPAIDSKRGILLKISDNAKMPLGQKNNSFAVRVNY